MRVRRVTALAGVCRSRQGWGVGRTLPPGQDRPDMLHVAGFFDERVEKSQATDMAFHAVHIGMHRRLMCKRLLRVNLVAGITAELVTVRILPRDDTERSDHHKCESEDRNTYQDGLPG